MVDVVNDYLPYVDSYGYEQLVYVDQDIGESTAPIGWDDALNFKGYYPKRKDMKLIFKMFNQEVTFLFKFPYQCFINEKSHTLLAIPETYEKTPDIQ